MKKPMYPVKNAAPKSRQEEAIKAKRARLLMLLTAGRRIRDCDMSGAALSRADIGGLIGDNIRLNGADLAESILRQSQLIGCDFREANLAEANLSESTLRLCTFDGARAQKTQFEKTCIEDCSLQGADFSGACLRRARLSESSWARASLQEAILEEAHGDGTSFRGADLRGASLVRAKLVDADFRGADLTGANFSNADIARADFRGAILDNVQWNGCRCDGAYFDAGTNILPASTSGETQIIQPNTSSTGQSDAGSANLPEPDILIKALAQLFTQAISSSAKGRLRVDAELQKVAAAYQQWQVKPGTGSINDVVRLFESIESAVGSTGIASDGTAKSFARLMHALETAGDEPPAEWKAWLQQLFPEIAQMHGEESLDTLAASFEAILGKSKGEGQ